MGGSHNSAAASGLESSGNAGFEPLQQNPDMGGADFGISDTSWDDAGGGDAGGGGDWDN
jgi:hypothetical protein